MSQILINGTFLKRQVTGGQRYAREITTRLLKKGEVKIAWSEPTHPDIDPGQIWYIPPNFLTKTLGSRLWSQVDLVQAMGSHLLWSPENIGPLGVKNHVVTILDLATFDHPEWFSPHFIALYRFYLPRLIKQVKLVLTISEFSRSRILEQFGLPENLVVAIPCGVAERFRPCSEAQIDQIKERYNLPPTYVLSLGSLEPRKNLSALFQAWQLLPASARQSVGLVVAGGKGKNFAQQDFGTYGNTIPNLHFMGYFPDDDLPALYSGALCLVYPSLYEGFGLPPLEAMACGTPVLTSNRTSLPEVVGSAALQVDPLQPEAIADALQQLIENPILRHQLSRAGIIRSQQFSWDRAAELTYERLLRVSHGTTSLV